MEEPIDLNEPKVEDSKELDTAGIKNHLMKMIEHADKGTMRGILVIAFVPPPEHVKIPEPTPGNEIEVVAEIYYNSEGELASGTLQAMEKAAHSLILPAMLKYALTHGEAVLVAVPRPAAQEDPGVGPMPDKTH